jgi:hypothetical protein
MTSLPNGMQAGATHMLQLLSLAYTELRLIRTVRNLHKSAMLALLGKIAAGVDLVIRQ